MYLLMGHTVKFAVKQSTSSGTVPIKHMELHESVGP